MLKSIKKSFKYFVMLAGIMIAIPTLLFLLIRIPEVQTYLVRRITGQLSREIKSTIKTGRIEYTFFNKLAVNDVLITDSHQDTMIYSQRMTVGIRRLDFRNQIFKFGDVTLTKPVVAFITDSTGLMNLKWYLDMLDNPEDTLQRKNKVYFSINKVEINDAKFSLVNRKANESKMMVDFNNLGIADINGSVKDFKIEGDSLSFSINGLRFAESAGFLVNNMNSNFLMEHGNIIFNDVNINCSNSIISAPRIGLYPDTSGSFGNFTREVRLDILLEESQVSSRDLMYFVPFAEEIDETISVSGRVTGYIEELKGRNIRLAYREKTSADIDFDFSGLTKIGDAFIFLGINELNASINDIEKLRLPSKKNLIIPDILNKLGDISFEGNFTGFTTDFVTYGMIRTDKGDIRTDVSLRPEGKNSYRIRGLISGKNIALGEITGSSELFGNLDVEAQVDGIASSMNKFTANLTGQVDSVEINSYTYRNVVMNGTFTEKTWDGNIKIDESNIRMDLLGTFNFKEKLPEFDFTLNLADADLYRLNFDKTDTTSALSMLMTANFKGTNIDNLDGEIKLLNSTLSKYNTKLELYDFSLRAFTDDNQPVISLKTDFVDADLRGYYNFAGLGNLFKSALASLMPSRFTPPVMDKGQRTNNFTFSIDLKNTDKINTFFRTGLTIAENSTISGIIKSDSLISVTGESKMLNFRNNIFNNLNLNANVTGETMLFELNSSSLSLLGQSDLKDLKIGFNTTPDNFIFRIDWDNKEKILNKGNFSARGLLTANSLPGRAPVLNIAIDSSRIFLKDRLWKISQSVITIDSNAVDIDRLFLSNDENYYMVKGTISENPADTLHLEFNGLDLSFLNNLGSKKRNNEEKMQLDIKGILSGNILMTDIYKNIMLESNIDVSGFSMLGSEYGNISAESVWNNKEKVVDIRAGNDFKGVRMLDIGGIYDPRSKMMNLDVVTKGLPVDALNPLLDFFASDIEGKASGKINLSGELNKLLLTGSVKAENTSITIDYLQTRYQMNDSVKFDKKGIWFDNIILTDERGNTASLDGRINHNHFKDFTADIAINVDNNMVLNTKAKDNELFYGTAFATGVTTIKSSHDLLSFDISARTERNTKFFMPLNTGLTVSEYSFINFVDNDSIKALKADKAGSVTVEDESSGLDLKIEIEVTPDAEIQLLIDPKAGDVIKGHGTGTLTLNLSPEGEFKISGDYVIEDGEYLYTLGNFINKSFSVENGGKIAFNGDIENADIDLKAIYRLNTSLYEILQDERFNERIPVECHLILSGKLFNPVIGLDIYLPRADEETRSYLRNVITTEEEKSRQFIYLLVMNSFYAESLSRSTTNTTTTGTSAMAVTTTEMVSNQLSNMLSDISNRFDIGFNYRPGYKGLSSQEVQVALSTQLLNDKVTINGNFDVRGSGTATNNTNQITGDFDAEVRLTEKIRFKVFNRFNNPYTGKGVPYTQGIGLLFKQDFNRFSDLFKKKEKPEIKKEDEIAPE